MTIEQYFKDKIDWKFFNYLLDILTLLEDKNEYYEISVYVKDFKDNFHQLYEYIYSDNFDDEFRSHTTYKTPTASHIKNVIDDYQNYGLYYLVDIPSTAKKNPDYKIIMDKLNNIKNMELYDHKGVEFIFKNKSTK